MNPLSPFFALIIFTIAFVTAFLLNRKFKIKFTVSRYETIDGLRGFLALGVFMHHAAIWHQYLHTGVWDVPQSNFYTFLGQGGVALFFMITSFLFVSKLLHAKEAGVNWKTFFIHRMRRIFPLYYFSLVLIIILSLAVAGWQLNLAFPKFLETVLNWSLFTINKTPLLNEYKNTITLNAGVVWSLPYEWLFYFALPLIALLILKRKPSRVMLAVSAAFIIVFCIIHGVKGYYIYTFIGGGIAPFILKYTKLATKIKDIHAAIIISVCFALILLFPTVNNIFCILLLTIIFTLIALGRSVFGIFINKTMQFLGDISYSTYLLHGIILFTVFYFIEGFAAAQQLTSLQYCGLIFLITPVVVVISFCSYYFIEQPFMKKIM